MSHHTVLTITAILAAAFGLPLVLAPDALLSVFGLKADLVARGMSRLHGGGLLMLAIVCWTMRGIPAGPIASRLCTALALGNGVAAAINAYVQINGVTNAVGWSTPVLSLALCAAFAVAARSDRTTGLAVAS